MMKAWRYEGGSKAFHLRELPIPEVAEDEVLIKVEAAGLCHSDCHVVHGNSDHMIQHRIPITLGHEVAGTVVKIGHKISSYTAGDKVVVALITHPEETFFYDDTPGLAYDGGYGQYVIGRERNLLKVPEGISLAEAAVATDSLATAYQAVVDVAGAKLGTTIGVIGLGGLGLAGARYGVLAGATVYGFETNLNKHQTALDLGLKACYTSLSAAKGVCFDVIVDFVGMSSTVQAAVENVRDRGKIVVVGLAEQNITYPAHTFVIKALSLTASLGGSLHGFQAVLNYISSGDFKPVLEEIAYADVKAGLQRLEGGEVVGRLWTNPSLG